MTPVSPASRRLIEGYLVEVVSRAAAAQKRCSALLALDYISTAPKNLATTIQRLCDCLSTAAEEIVRQIDWNDSDSADVDLDSLRVTDAQIQRLSAQLRYIEAARTERLPWSIVRPFEKFVSALAGADIMLRPQWNYNYGSHIQDFREAYRELLIEYQEYIGGQTIDQVLSALPNAFHILTFPALEKRNILLHSVLGHEVGHLLVDRFLTPERRNAFATSVQAEVAETTDRQLDLVELAQKTSSGTTFFRSSLLASNAQLVVRCWTRALEELLSDVAGAILFGPAALFSSLEVAMQDGFDYEPTLESNLYPPWRLRLKTIYGVLTSGEAVGMFPVPATSFPERDTVRTGRVNERIDFIKDLVATRTDPTDFTNNQFVILAYKNIETYIEEGTAYLRTECERAGGQVTAATLYPYLPPLIERLDHQIPPNAVELGVDDMRAASIVQIINAAWFCRASSGENLFTESNILNPDIREQRRVLDNLTLKAIEYTDLMASAAGRYRSLGE